MRIITQMITANIPFEIRKSCQNHYEYFDVWSYLNNFLGTQEEVHTNVINEPTVFQPFKFYNTHTSEVQQLELCIFTIMIDLLEGLI